jgi:uroporphyrinogen-III synthase
MPLNDHSSYGIIEVLGEYVRGKVVLLVRSDSGSDLLLDGLIDHGAEVIDFAAYRLKEVGMTDELSQIMDGIHNRSVDVITFTSPMSAESFIVLLRDRYGVMKAAEMMEKVKVAAIGRPTYIKLESLGRKPDIIPERTTFFDMLLSIREYHF